MDQHARFRSRGIRTIGRISAPASEDVLLAQWPLQSMASKRQDVAVSSDWGARRTKTPSRTHQEQSDPILLFDAYDRHQRQAVMRLLDAIDAELQGTDHPPVVFEPPTTMQTELLAIIRRCASEGTLPAHLAETLESRTVAAGEWVVRCWALIELYRADLLTADEVQIKRNQIAQDLAETPPLVP